MRYAGNFHPEWGYLAPAPNFIRTARVILVATAVGAFGATQILAANENALKPDLARAVRWQLEPWTRTPTAQTTKGILR